MKKGPDIKGLLALLGIIFVMVIVIAIVMQIVFVVFDINVLGMCAPDGCLPSWMHNLWDKMVS